MRVLIPLAVLALSACGPTGQSLTETVSPTAHAKGATATVGKPAPAFSLTDLDGKTHNLADYKGKTVVVEWFNPGCPYVVAAHGEGPLKDMAKTYMDQGVVWLAVNSGAPGKEGHGIDVNKKAVADWAMPNPVLLDESGATGKAYGAKTTPHLYVINPEGNLVYNGGLDNAPRGAVPEVGYRAFAKDAIDATLAGQPVTAANTQPWGCSVKYGS